MNQINRRGFLKQSLTATAGSYLGLSSSAHILANSPGPNNQLRIAVAGIRGQGNGHIGRFQKLPGVKVVGLCDPDRQILSQRVEQVKSKQGATGSSAVRGYADIRQVLDQKDIDAVVIATPNHWHSLMAIWACQAGKHVYVEKPVSHCIWEGRRMVEAARKYDRIVQAGTQQRSCPAVQEAARDIQAGKYGKVLWVHCSKLGARGPIGKVTEPQPVPSHIDYNLWAGPAPMTPVMRKSFHYDWHWQWNWGDGEMGNWGIHYVDDLRHLLGWKDIPTKVIAAGNRFAWDDNGETPNMHFALFDYEGVKVVVDIRNLPDPKRPAGKRAGGKSGAVYLHSRGGNYIQCEHASIRLARGGGGAYDKQGQRIKQYKGDGGRVHGQNFIDAVRSGRRQDLNAEIEVCHYSTAMCHQANLGFRAGATATVDEVRQSMKAHEDALNTLQDMLEQIEGNQVDLAKSSFLLGPELTYDRKQERFVEPKAESANRFVKCSYRDPFIVPQKV